MKPKKEKIKCPYCGYIMPIERDRDAVCRGLHYAVRHVTAARVIGQHTSDGTINALITEKSCSVFPNSLCNMIRHVRS